VAGSRGVSGIIPGMAIRLLSAVPADLDLPTAYAMLRLRVDVFVVEQDCPYPELDGRDLEPDAVWVWAADDDTVVGTLRILTEPDGTRRIGRVATAASARSSGVASDLMRHALGLCTGQPVTLDAQEHLESWYARFGFTRSGPRFVEDGIPHVPMTRPA
jgi:ElaA protein